MVVRDSDSRIQFIETDIYHISLGPRDPADAAAEGDKWERNGSRKDEQKGMKERVLLERNGDKKATIVDELNRQEKARKNAEEHESGLTYSTAFSSLLLSFSFPFRVEVSLGAVFAAFNNE